MSEEAMKKMDSLETLIKSLSETVDKLTKAQPVPVMVDGKPVDISKVLADVGDLQKKANETAQQVEKNERASIIAKMDSQGRVAFKPEGVAYTLAELQALPMDILKFAAANSPSIPMQAKGIYKGEQDPNAIDPKLKGSELVEKAWEHEYSNLELMRKRFQN